MLKFLVGFSAAPGMDRAACHRHYRDRHGPLVAGVPEFWRHVRGYLQNFAEPNASSKADPTRDGVSELWFDDWAGYERAFAEPRYIETIRPDEHRFGDLDRLELAFAHDEAVFGGGATPRFKLFRFLMRSPGVSAADFAGRWQGDYAAGIARDPVIRRTAAAYVQNRSVPSGEVPFPVSRLYDGVDEYWFDDAGAVADFAAAEAAIVATGMAAMAVAAPSIFAACRDVTG